MMTEVVNGVKLNEVPEVQDGHLDRPVVPTEANLRGLGSRALARNVMVVNNGEIESSAVEAPEVLTSGIGGFVSPEDDPGGYREAFGQVPSVQKAYGDYLRYHAPSAERDGF